MPWISPLHDFYVRAKLEFAIISALALFSVGGYSQSGTLAYDNGPFINRPGQGPDGGDGSVLQNGMGVIGWPAVQGQARVADDFTVPSGQSWAISRIRFFSYFPVVPTNPPYAGVTLQVWDGQPGTENARVIWGNDSSNILSGSSFAGAYRYREGGPDTLRPVFWVDAAINALFAPGTYWLDWAFTGPPDAFGEPHQMPITIDGQQATGNALWVGGPVIDVQPQGFPFQIFTNRPPTAAAGQDQTIECTRAPVTLNGRGSTDPDNDHLTFTWWEGANHLVTGETVEVHLPSGSHAIRLVVTDPGGASSEDTTIVTVRDTSPPAISRIGATPNVLWPPNRQMVPVRLTVNASDQCDPTIVSRITRVTSSEGAGPSRDWEITGPLSLNLRAARSGGSERVYTIFVEAIDSQNNKSTASVRVVVPKSQSKYLRSRLEPQRRGNDQFHRLESSRPGISRRPVSPARLRQRSQR